jgi:site-specific DNA-methyltransferase (adenine-specific)
VRVETIGDATLYLGDCRDVIPTLEPFDAAITSPPYGEIRTYGAHGPTDLLAVISCMAAKLKEGGVCMWNVSDQVIEGSESGDSFRHALHAIASGLRLHDTMIYCKEGVTFPDANRYLPCFEYMFVFARGAPKHFNGLRDRRNKLAGATTHGFGRQPDGSLVPGHKKGNRIPEMGLRRNWWVLNPDSSYDIGHPARMPPSMAVGHIVTWTDPGETVLDPFMGSGTTGVACAKLGRKFVGIEINEGYFDIACRRIETEQNQLRLAI